MIPGLAGYAVKKEGKKFLQLDREFDDSPISNSLLRKNEELPLYIHIPFCRKLCPFCCFNRYLFDEKKARNYFKSLRKEIDIYINRDFKFSEFYFGGGTPTILMDELVSFIEYLRRKFEVKTVSLETTPAELNKDTISVLKSAGIGRLSLGVQSFNNEMLKSMGRTICTGEEAKEKILLAKGQFPTINIDLIFNFPFQNLETFKSDIKIFKNIGVDQVTFYPLMPSPHKKNAMERKFSRVDNTQEKKYYDVILEEFYNQDFKTSTVWCFSKDNCKIDEYIVDYADYLGIGSGSVSLINGIFFVNTFSLNNYSEMLDKSRLPITRLRNLSEKEYLRYYLLTKLFGTKINKESFLSQFGTAIESKLRFELYLLKMAGVIQENDNIIKVTRGGMFTVSVMMREFFASLNTLREKFIEKQI